MGVPVLIFIACFAVGVVAAARWLPDLALGQVGGIAFFVVSGLAGAALGLVGLHLYQTVLTLDNATLMEGAAKADVLSSWLVLMLRDAGSIVGFAAIVYLLAPAADEQPIDDLAEPDSLLAS
jgi:hypothetical protein